VASPYLRVLRIPGALAFSAAGLVARIPLSMISIAFVLLVEDARDSYTLAGIVSATAAVAEGLAQPVFGRLVDRFGQMRVIGPEVLAHTAFLITFVWAVDSGASAAVLILLAVLSGATFPPISTLVRARWNALLEGQSLRTAYSWESVLDELVFVVGPPLATIVAVQVNPTVAALSMLMFLVPGTIALLAQRRTEPAVHPEAGRGPGAIRARGMPVVFLVMLLLGAMFGAVEVATIGLADEAGTPGTAGIVLAVYAVGSLLGGLVFGQLQLRSSTRRQLLLSLGALAATAVLVPPAAALGLGWLAVSLLLAGAAVSPSLISGFGMVTELVPRSSVTEGLTWAGSGLVLGFAAGTASSGAGVDGVGAESTFWLVAVAAWLALALALVGRSQLRTAPNSLDALRPSEPPGA
jgi:MFS family permease